jgi:hypothetical protein
MRIFRSILIYYAALWRRQSKKAHIEGLTQGLAELSSMTRLYQVMEKNYTSGLMLNTMLAFINTGKQIDKSANQFYQTLSKRAAFSSKTRFQSFEAERIIIPSETVGAALQAYVDKEVPQNNQQQKEALGEAFFKTVCELGLIKPVLDTSVLSQTQQDYEFLHLTFQEYYTAIYLAKAFSSQRASSSGIC